jgi:glycosyltransferase involved in cell wall biosynthesis
MTTYGRRLRTVYIALESIARGKVLPSRIVLWIDDRKLFDNLPASIERLVQRGLEVKLCDNFGPHTKYYPYVASQETFKDALVIADDDQIYPRWWLARLVEAYRESPHVINCHWAVVMGVGMGIAKYQTWKRNGYNKPTFAQMALGTSGVIYPPKLLAVFKAQGNVFRDCCPKADDVWLHVQGLRAGYKTRQIRNSRLYSLQIIGSQRFALARENDSGGNDRQIAATYTAEDIRKMSEE